jgi:CRISPR-associated Cas5-like protein
MRKNKFRPIRADDHWESGEVFFVRIKGAKACFSRPEFRAARVSSLVPSHSAVNGILSAYLSHKGVSYSAQKIGLLFYPQLVNITTNEVNNFGLGNAEPIIVDSRRTQIKTQALFDVDYWLSFRLAADTPDDVLKYSNMLNSRLPIIKPGENDLTRMGGVWNRMPYLGLREYVGRVERTTPEVIAALDGDFITHRDGTKSVDFSSDLGITFFGTDYGTNCNYFAPMSSKHGVLTYPTWKQVRNQNLILEFS